MNMFVISEQSPLRTCYIVTKISEGGYEAYTSMTGTLPTTTLPIIRELCLVGKEEQRVETSATFLCRKNLDTKKGNVLH